MRLGRKRLKPQRFLDYARNDRVGRGKGRGEAPRSALPLGLSKNPLRLIALAWIVMTGLISAATLAATAAWAVS